MNLRLFRQLLIKEVYFTNNFLWVISRTLSHAIVNIAVLFKREALFRIGQFYIQARNIRINEIITDI